MTATAMSFAAAPAHADPGAELMDVTGRILQELPGSSTSSADLPSLFSLLIPGAPQRDSPQRADPIADRKTACTDVTHIGDSTSVGIDDAAASSDPADRLSAQYERVGVTSTVLDAGGGRSIVEQVNGEPNAVQAIEAERAKGRKGCWVIAMGVNDAANIAVGSTVTADQRIDRVMKALEGQRVLWPTVATHGSTDAAYAEKNMDAFNTALRRAAHRYPNLHVYDFSAEAQPSWYADGIHYNSTGNAQRSRLLATALATAFPKSAGPMNLPAGR